MPLHIGRRTWLAVALLALVAVGLASWVFSFETDAPDAPPTAAVERPVRTPRPRREVPPPPPPRPSAGDDNAPSPVEVSRDVAGITRVPETLLVQSPQVRRQRVESRIDEVADARGWSDGKTEEIQELVGETLQGVESRLSGVSRPRDWSRARREVGRYRQEQARRIQEALGDDDYATFVSELEASRIPSPTGQPGIRWIANRLRDDAP
ncbi:MAG: hypothetical protein AAF211_10565 [Myxococcota bacterium]